MVSPRDTVARPTVPTSGVTAFLGRRGVEVVAIALVVIGLACMAALASYNPMGPGSTDGWRAAVSSLFGQSGTVIAGHLYRSMGAASWLLGPLFVVWGWQLGTRKQSARPGQLVIVAPLILGLACLALAVLRPFSDWPRTNLLNGGVIGDRLYEALIPKATAVIGLNAQWIGLLVVLLAAAGLHVALGGSDTFKQWAERITKAFPRLAALRIGLADSGSPGDGSGPLASQPVTVAATAPRSGKAAEKRNKLKRHTRADFGPAKDYRLPALKLLAAHKTGGKKAGSQKQKKELADSAELVESALAEFGVKGKVVEIRPGPVVTLYEFQPAAGVKSSQVIGLADDVARSLGADSARVAAIPGRKALGIEIPNKVREMVALRQLLASEDYAEAPPGLTLALGKDIGGGPVVADLAAMPHLLVAGTTGSGKSVGISTMILSLLYRLTPNQCRFIMIDPKMLELTAFDGIPHLLAPVVTDPDEAVASLDWTVREMEYRYQAMSELGVRNIAGYNARIEKTGGQGEMDPETGEPAAGAAHPLPHIVVVVDEIADLMLTAGKEVETAVQRIAQMARAAGIHLIMATQRPSSDVITGTIKANFPTRISFQVTSKIDSRTVLGEGGAEQLLGQGDMLYMAGGGRFIRVHGAFISDEEVEAVVRFLKDQGEPLYIDAVTEGEGLAQAASSKAVLEPKRKKK